MLPTLKWRAFSLLLPLCVALTTGCSGGGGGSPVDGSGSTTPKTNPQAAPQASAAATGTPTPLLVYPGSLVFSAVGQTQTFSAQEMSYTNSFSAVSSASSVATVQARSYATFTVTAIAAGTATITVTDVNGLSTTVTVDVGTTSGNIN